MLSTHPSSVTVSTNRKSISNSKVRTPFTFTMAVLTLDETIYIYIYIYKKKDKTKLCISFFNNLNLSIAAVTHSCSQQCRPLATSKLAQVYR